MDFLNESAAQVRDLFLSMTAGARLTAALLLAVIVISVSYLFTYQSQTADEFLFGGSYLSSDEADLVEAAIAQAGLKGWERTGNRVRVPRANKSAFLAAVASASALPRNFHSVIEQAVESGPFVGREQTQQKIKVAKQQQISMMLRQLDWVDNALVMYEVEKLRGVQAPFGRLQGTGTVTVTPVAGQQIDPIRRKMLQNLVSGAILGLQADDVTVVDARNNGIISGDNAAIAEVIDDPYYKRRIMYENHVRQQILNMLNYIPNVRVEVSAELETIVEHSTHSVIPDSAASVALRQKKQASEEERARPDRGGAVGATAQGPARTGEQVAKVEDKDRSTTESQESDMFVAATEEMKRLNGLTPTKVKATISIPQSYLVEIWRQDNPTANGDPPQAPDVTQINAYRDAESKKIEMSVVQLLPAVKESDPYSQVKVQMIKEIDVPELAPPSIADNVMAFTGQYWGWPSLAW